LGTKGSWWVYVLGTNAGHTPKRTRLDTAGNSRNVGNQSAPGGFMRDARNSYNLSPVGRQLQVVQVAKEGDARGKRKAVDTVPSEESDEEEISLSEKARMLGYGAPKILLALLVPPESLQQWIIILHIWNIWQDQGLLMGWWRMLVSLCKMNSLMRNFSGIYSKAEVIKDTCGSSSWKEFLEQILIQSLSLLLINLWILGIFLPKRLKFLLILGITKLCTPLQCS
jgi:hypothetical protein